VTTPVTIPGTKIPTPTPPTPPSPIKARIVLPVVSHLALRHQGKHSSIAFAISQPGSATVLLQRVTSGHRSHGRCVTPKLKHKPSCNVYSTVATISKTVAQAGTVSVQLPTKVHGHALPAGHYRLLVTPTGSAGRKGAARAIELVLVH
jgi:hypothetical protein